MPPLSWDVLEVVATDSLVADTGAGVGSTFVRSPDGYAFAVRNSAAEAVVPNILMAEEEVRSLIASGTLLATPKWPAKRRHVVLVKSADFSRACARVRHVSTLAWTRSPSGLDMAYVLVEDSNAWQQQCARDMLRWARKRLRGRPPQVTLKEVEEVLLEALCVCDRRSPRERELYILLGVLLGELAPERWPAVAESATLQMPGLDRATLEKEVSILRVELFETTSRVDALRARTAHGDRSLLGVGAPRKGEPPREEAA